MWSDDGWGALWLVISIVVFVFCALFAGLCQADRDPESARKFAIAALTAYLWPLYLALALIYALIELVGMALRIDDPVRAILRTIKTHPWERR